MGVEISRGEIERLARELSEITGESPDEAVRRALAEKIDRLARPALGSQAYEERKTAFFARLDARPRTADPRPWKQIEDEELYDERGQPIG
ncbi:hypothetical protein DMC25_21500 [Caulobacter sp. D4A]|uniref:type II toxin-antitoxin system VapB family antitoxin n=1 Tax=unclassified Caulobacter TaxID=2648921 RepID=UPI000D73C547|nr:MULTISPECIES: type II toxin-antitoxin system VapB family antitoxin [unclassified Caulobacter]PXA79874.1 hypothetical protein DMC25_21500 [Caulobacter sp. D4A]PXA94858.1 hypothetical protein DMC18_05420 [Caulobacter sp. D5]